MKLFQYFRLNTWQLIVITVLLMVKSIVQLYDFPAPAWVPLAGVGLFLLAFLLSLIIINKWEFKLYTLIFVFAFSYVLSFLSLWKIPASHYVQTIEKNYAPSLLVIHNATLQSARFNEENGLQQRGKDTLTISATDSLAITDLLKDNGILGIEKCDAGTLLMIECFIGNGYGVFYSNEKAVELIKQKSRYTINGYEVTSLTHIHGNWYYLSFT